MAEYKPSDYEFPELYVKNRSSAKYINVDLTSRTYTISMDPRGPLVLGLTVYEEGASIHDLDALKTRGTYAVLLPGKHEAILVEESVGFHAIEVRGVQVNFVAREGDYVREGSVLSYVLTGKGETRTIRSTVSGIVTYILWFRDEPGQRYAYIIVDVDSIVRLRRSE